MMGAERGLALGLLAAAGALCAVLTLEVTAWRQEPQPSRRDERVMVVPDAHPPDAAETPDQHAAWLRRILARPVFNPDRRPVEVGARGLPRLTGIVVAGAQRVAIFAARANEHPIVAQAGAHIGAYEVRTIADDGVTLVGPEGTTLIRPVFDLAPPPAAASPAVRLPLIRQPQAARD
jgi:hypothetical protein